MDTARQTLPIAGARGQNETAHSDKAILYICIPFHACTKHCHYFGHQGPRHEFQGGGAKFYESNLNLVVQNKASLEILLFTKKVGGGGGMAMDICRIGT